MYTLHLKIKKWKLASIPDKPHSQKDQKMSEGLKSPGYPELVSGVLPTEGWLLALLVTNKAGLRHLNEWRGVSQSGGLGQVGLRSRQSVDWSSHP